MEINRYSQRGYVGILQFIVQVMYIIFRCAPSKKKNLERAMEY